MNIKSTIKNVLLILFCFGVFKSYATYTITIPSTLGTDTTRLMPTNRSTAYSASRMIYTSSEISMLGTITELSFQKASGSTSTSVNYISIYLKETTDTSVTTSVPSGFPTGYKKVYNSSYIDNSMSSGWTKVTLSTDPSDTFNYSGFKNLDIIIVKVASETPTSNYPIYNCFSKPGGNKAAYYYGSSSFGSSFTGTTTNRPNIKIGFDNYCSGMPSKGSVTGPIYKVCSGGSFTLTNPTMSIGAGLKYQWQWRNAGSGSAFSNTSSDDTTLSLTTSITTDKEFRIYAYCSISGLSDTSSAYTVNVFNAPVNSSIGDTVFCAGDSVKLRSTVELGVSYTWYKDGITTGVNDTVYYAKTTGVYTVKAYTPSCTTGFLSNTKSVTANALPNTTVTVSGSTTFCAGDSITFSAVSVSGNTYRWMLNDTTLVSTSNIFTTTIAGKYKVKITNVSLGGCTDSSANITVIVNPNPSKPLLSTISGKAGFCIGSNVTLNTTSVSGITYQWYNSSGIITGATANAHTTSSADKYVLKATLGTCSINSDSLKIDEFNLPIVSITPTGTKDVCNGDSLTISTIYAPNTSYQWYKSGLLLSGDTLYNINAKTSGIYSIEATNKITGCWDTTTSKLTVNIVTIDTPTVSIIRGVTKFCGPGEVLLKMSSAVSLSMQWQKNSVDIPGETTDSLLVNTTGNYRIKVGNLTACKSYSLPISIFANPLPDSSIVTTAGTNICYGETTELKATVNSSYTYQWKESGIDIPGETNTSLIVKSAGIYSVHIVDTNGCESTSDPVNVTLKYVSSFSVMPHGNTYFCDGEKTLLTTQNGFTTYQWYYNGVFIPGAIDTFTYATSTGKYTVKVQDPVNGCFATSPAINIITIVAPDTPFITQVGKRLSTSVIGVSYQWYKDSILIPGAIDSFIFETGPALYHVVVTNNLDCSKSASLDLRTTAIAHQVQQDYNIKIYPNPVKDVLHVDCPKDVKVWLSDMQGRTLTDPAVINQIDMSKYTSGIYLLHFTNNEGAEIASQKIAKIE